MFHLVDQKRQGVKQRKFGFVAVVNHFCSGVL